MRDFRDKIAVITGAGSGMGKELALQLSAAGAHLALCDIDEVTLRETERACRAVAGTNAQVSARSCDVSDEAQVLAFRDAVQQRHAAQHIDLLFNNAGIGGGNSFVKDARSTWEKTFNVCWFGVYYCARAFMPLLLKSREARIVNVSSINGFFATGTHGPHSAYSTAKFAVKGFSEALYTDLRIHAPHVKVVLVMPGYVGTSIMPNTLRSQGFPDPDTCDASQLGVVRDWLTSMSVDVAGLDDAQVRTAGRKRMNAFRDNAALSASDAASIILGGIRAGQWRILVGHDAERLDRFVREEPASLYEPASLAKVRVVFEEERQRTFAEAHRASRGPEQGPTVSTHGETHRELETHTDDEN
jgi:NAD(P)-dependent dehydrogenase (short-subunit alcohol dehydrogenase family)